MAFGDPDLGLRPSADRTESVCTRIFICLHRNTRLLPYFPVQQHRLPPLSASLTLSLTGLPLVLCTDLFVPGILVLGMPSHATVQRVFLSRLFVIRPVSLGCEPRVQILGSEVTPLSSSPPPAVSAHLEDSWVNFFPFCSVVGVLSHLC